MPRLPAGAETRKIAGAALVTGFLKQKQAFCRKRGIVFSI